MNSGRVCWPAGVRWASRSGGSALPMPYVGFDPEWRPATTPPAFGELYARSRELDPRRTAAAAIAVERIPTVVLVAGGDDQVWPSLRHAQAIGDRRAGSGLATTIVTDPDAGHRTVLPGEQVIDAGLPMQRGGTPEADRRLGELA
ncbi:acyl-CoA thioester hydrolase/BAAT C-terminal domain-containing protein [Microlunatus sp. Y2014]|uniref:acyl-CoA thioester hydrolase/BAAT C-terminal domain-containing protein n=1 Tax=Microlunatus sp. Y2014 TaxID=3418488 RepID=UPI003DA6E3D7